METNFKQRVLQIVAAIPAGEVMTYKEVAMAAGNARASRAVGMILKKNQNADIPCHRVIRSDGKPGGYNGLRGKNKKTLLQEEGAF